MILMLFMYWDDSKVIIINLLPVFSRRSNLADNADGMIATVLMEVYTHR